MELSAKQLAEEFELLIKGNPSAIINQLGSLKKIKNNALLWSKNPNSLAVYISGVVVCSQNDFDKITPNKHVTYLLTKDNPRLIFAKIAGKYFNKDINIQFKNYVSEHQKNKNIHIGEGVFIAENVVIGDGSQIHHHSIIYNNVTIGKNCIINTHTSIGTEGLGLVMDTKTNEYIKFPQLGGVIIKDNVEIGPSSTIRRSALDNTIIGKGTKIGSFCNIGHNSTIGENCILTANIIIAGSSTIGNNVFMGISSSVKNGITIGNNVTIGQAATVIKNIPDNETWVGNPAKKLK